MESHLIYYLSSIQNKNIKNENENENQNQNENIRNENENENEKIFTANHPASKYSFNTRNINKHKYRYHHLL